VTSSCVLFTGAHPLFRKIIGAARSHDTASVTLRPRVGIERHKKSTSLAQLCTRWKKQAPASAQEWSQPRSGGAPPPSSKRKGLRRGSGCTKWRRGTCTPTSQCRRRSCSTSDALLSFYMHLWGHALFAGPPAAEAWKRGTMKASCQDCDGT
jgi:hypothetical protein